MSVLEERSPGRAGAADPRGKATPRRPGRLLQCARFALAACVGFLAVRSIVAGGPQPLGDAPLTLRDVIEPSAWLAELAVAGLVGFSQSLALGLLLGLATWVPKSDRSAGRRIAIWWLGAAVLVLTEWVAWWRCPGAAFLAISLAGYGLGTWMGSTFPQGGRATLRLAARLGLLVAASGAGLGLVWLLAFDSAALSFEPPRVTSAETRRLADAFGSAHAGSGKIKRVRLTERDLDVIAALLLAQLPLEGKAKLTLEEARIETQLSLAIPRGAGGKRYVNIRAILIPKVSAGRLEGDLERLRVGRLPVPTVIARGLFARLLSAVHHDPDLGAVTEIVDSVEVKRDGLAVGYRPDDLSDDVFNSLLARVEKEPDAHRTAAIYYRHLVDAADGLPRGDERFAGFVRTAFALASKRSRAGDPIVESRAAILALAVLLGHERVEDLVGPVTDRRLRREARRRVGRVTLRNRRDWPRHFFVSAALTLVSGGAVSDGAGLFKEELDSGDGGSGFSFADLLADRAGTQFALAATRDVRSARQMQKRLAEGFAIDEVFPVAADLPERISSTELRTEYGGVGGVKYEAVVEEIERRLETCAALRPAVLR